jgi:hypothetical protein
MKKTTLLSSILSTTMALSAFAADTKLEGTATCAKCDLKTADKCRAAVVVTTADGKKETYLSAPNLEAKKLHEEICDAGKPATVEGTVTEKDGAKVITITKFTLK